MKYVLVNENFKRDYVDNLVRYRKASAQKLKNATKEDIQHPSALDNIDNGVKLLKDNLDRQQNILFIVDCDVDGFTSSSILWLYIKKIYPDAKLFFKIHEGKQHGLEDMMQVIEDDPIHYSLVILPDSSSGDYECHKRLKDDNTDCLVIDHHEAEKYSEYATVINNQLSNRYINKDLTGAGMVLQFCRYFDEIYGYNFSHKFYDLASLGIISDMGSMLSVENQAICHIGLHQEIKNVLFETYLEKQAYSIGSIERMNSISIAYCVTPLINALIRVGSQQEKENLFIAFIEGLKIVPSTKRGEKGMTETLATQVVRHSTNAKAHQNKIKEKALDELYIEISNNELDKNQVIVIDLSKTDIDLIPELNGLVAMQLASRYKRPAIVARENNEGFLKGSARGLSNSQLKSFKDYMTGTNLFEYCAGHGNACGISIPSKNIDSFFSLANKDLEKYDFGNDYYEVNFERYPNDPDIADMIFDVDSYNSIWGQQCEEPLVAIKCLNVSKKDISILGARKDTIKFTKFGIDYIQFKAQKFIEELNNFPDDIQMDLVCTCNVNEWGGRLSPQLMIKDCNIRDGGLSF